VTTGLKPGNADPSRHLDTLKELSGSRIDSPQIALFTFPCGVPELSIDPGDSVVLHGKRGPPDSLGQLARSHVVMGWTRALNVAGSDASFWVPSSQAVSPDRAQVLAMAGKICLQAPENTNISRAHNQSERHMRPATAVDVMSKNTDHRPSQCHHLRCHQRRPFFIQPSDAVVPVVAWGYIS
jgi:hypothetical protein